MLSVAAGLLVGIAVSAAVLRLTKTFLYGLSPFDPFSYIFALGLIIAGHFWRHQCRSQRPLNSIRHRF
jgi:hypothetical protein